MGDLLTALGKVPIVNKIPAVALRQPLPPEEKKDFKLIGNSFFVLVADDRANDRDAVKAALEKIGVQVTAASSGVECLEKARKDKFNIILVSDSMRMMDSVQVLRNLKNSSDNKNRDTYVYALVKDNGFVNEGDFKVRGFEGILRKPIGPDCLYRIVIDKASPAMLPDDEELIDEIKLRAAHEDIFSAAGLSFTNSLSGCDDNILMLQNKVLKFLELSEKIETGIEELLKANDTDEYMKDARTMRDISWKIGAMHLGDMFDDHVNMAKDDGLDVAEKHLKKLRREWERTVNALRRWIDSQDIDYEAVKEYD